MTVQQDLSLTARRVSLGDTHYPYFYGFDCSDQIVGGLSSYQADRFLVVTDTTVLDLHGDVLLPGLRRTAPVEGLAMAPGESTKTVHTLVRYLERAIASGATRRTVVVGFGGGIPGNVAGLLASLLYRGIRLVHVPTTTVAAMDSTLSVKQAINSSWGKNHIGSYYPPEAVYCDLRLLQTLPDKELRSGLCEMAKNCLAIRPEYVTRLREILAGGRLDSASTLRWLLTASLTAKSMVTAQDPHERGTGLVLEYGHTVGHALELCDQQARGRDGVSHGEGVAFGMLVAARLSAARNGLGPVAVRLHEDLAAALGAPTGLPRHLGPPDLLRKVRMDNKRGYLPLGPDEAALVLLKELGQPMCTGALPLVPVPLGLVEDVLADLSAQTTSVLEREA